LLQAGQDEPVKVYLLGIKTFWKMDNGQVDDWLASINKGEKPTLSRFSAKPTATQVAFFWFAFAWPALIVAALSWFRRKRIGSIWRFGVAGIVSGYLALFAAGWAIGYLLAGVLGAVADHSSLVMVALYGSTAASFFISFLVVLGVCRFFIAKENAT
jgi:hypothetical protein